MKLQIAICILSIYVLCPVLSLDPNWRLVFADEFNGNTVDTSKWNVRDMKGNYGNAELQYYAPQQVSVYNGTLIITANNVSYGGMRYVSGWVDTKNLFYTTYGRYEFRAQMPDGGKGMWPAIWLLSQELCWPLGAEFDIMEYRGFEPNVANGYYHYSSCCGCGVSSASAYKRAEENLATSFHVYALEWTPDSISWFVDGTRSGFFEKKNLASGYTQFDPTPHYIIINSAMGGGYAGNPDHTTRYPNRMYIDYVRVYHYSESCEGNTCSNHGCCDPNSLVCVCDAGWSGSSCEQWTGSFTNRFVSTNIQYTPATDEKVNGWDNGFSFYSDNNIAINNGLTLTLSTANCPSGCNGQAYSTGAWNSAKHSTYGTFTFIAKGPSVNGTGLSLQAAGRSTNNLLEQIAFVLTGTNRNFVQITTWHHNYQFNQGLPINLGFDASLGEHNYTFVWFPNNILFYIDGTLVRNATEVIPDVKLAMGVYYAAQPLWYGGSFVYNGPSTIKVSQASWTVAHTPGNCSAILPCQQAAEGTGTGLTGDYFDGDTATRFYTNYKLTRVDPTINFNWGTSSPDSAVSADYFSIRWTGQVQAPYSALYTFYSRSDDGVRLYVNGTLIIDAWVVQSATERSGTITLNRGVKYDIVLEYQETGGDAVQSLSWSSTCHTKQIIPQSRLYPCRRAANGAGDGLTGRYYSDRNLGTLVGTQIDSAINFNWGSNGPSALRNGQSDLFSISWTGFVLPRYSGNYTFYASSDDGSRLYVNGQLLVNQWVDKSLSEFSGTINLVHGVKYSITYQYYENGGGAAAYLYWSSNCEAKQIVPQSQLFSS